MELKFLARNFDAEPNLFRVVIAVITGFEDHSKIIPFKTTLLVLHKSLCLNFMIGLSITNPPSIHSNTFTLTKTNHHQI